MPIPAIILAAGGATVAAIGRAAASTLVRQAVIGTAVWFGGNYVIREGLKDAKKTVGVTGDFANSVTKEAEDTFEKSVRRLALPIIVGYVLYDQVIKK